MSNPHCRCGFQAGNDDDLAAHLSEALVPDDDLTADGVIHAEGRTAQAAGLKACLCGFSASGPEALDDHLLTAFASGDDRPPHGFTRPAAKRPGG